MLSYFNLPVIFYVHYNDTAMSVSVCLPVCLPSCTFVLVVSQNPLIGVFPYFMFWFFRNWGCVDSIEQLTIVTFIELGKFIRIQRIFDSMCTFVRADSPFIGLFPILYCDSKDIEDVQCCCCNCTFWKLSKLFYLKNF